MNEGRELLQVIARQQSKGLSVGGGIVQAISAGQVTCLVDGTDVEVTMKYFSSYIPTVGDEVMILKNGSDWTVMAALAT
jgi:hypothetical protein